MQMVVGLVLGLGAHVPQIMLNFKQVYIGTLAAATFAFNAVSNVINGSVALVLTRDPYIIGPQIWMLSLNMTILGQILSHKHSNGLSNKGKREVMRRYSFDAHDLAVQQPRLDMPEGFAPQHPFGLVLCTFTSFVVGRALNSERWWMACGCSRQGHQPLSTLVYCLGRPPQVAQERSDTAKALFGSTQCQLVTVTELHSCIGTVYYDMWPEVWAWEAA